MRKEQALAFNDGELDGLAHERDRVFGLLKEARDERKRLGQVCTRLHDDLDAAYKAQQRIFQANQSAWEQHQRFMQDCSQKIQFWHAEADRCHAQMTEAFAQSQRCWNSGDKTGAKSWSETGKRHQAEMRSAKEQAAYWVSQSKDAQYRFKSGHSSEMESAKKKTRQLKADFETASARLKAVKAEVERLERQLESARAKFQTRLDWLKMEAPRERERRLQREASREGERLEHAMRLYREAYYSTPGRDQQGASADGKITTQVKCGWSRDHEMPCTDILIFIAGVAGHQHVVIGENGEVFTNHWTKR
jgi:chromosome segregation ATPase